jgi:hypothetical protein
MSVTDSKMESIIVAIDKKNTLTETHSQSQEFEEENVGQCIENNKRELLEKTAFNLRHRR